jgi:hypothetical protein
LGHAYPFIVICVITLCVDSYRDAYLFEHDAHRSLFMFGKMRVFHRSDLQLLHMLLAMLPVCLATFIAISRLMDYHHNFSDVNAGIFIGKDLVCCLTLTNNIQRNAHNNSSVS